MYGGSMAIVAAGLVVLALSWRALAPKPAPA
jgi:hypothetical protein